MIDGAEYVTLGDIQVTLLKMRKDGMSREAIEYVLNRVYWENAK